MISIKNARKNYQDFALDISMEIPGGRVSGLVGKNGAGKSTTIKLILGLIKPDEGSVGVLGRESSSLQGEEKEEIGTALAEAGFCSQFTVDDVEHILMKMYRRFDKSLFEKKCRELQIPMNKKIQEFSTGMKAKLRVLAAMTHQAKLLVLDEPTAGLDIEARNEILDMLREYIAQDDERSILVTSHISSDLESLCDDIYLIHDGKIILHEDTDVILDQYGILKVSEEEYLQIEKKYLLRTQKENYGYACFTAEKKFYQENYPGMVVENGGLDELILMMTGGYQ